MINLIIRKRTTHKQERKPMRLVGCFMYFDANVPFIANRSRNITGLKSVSVNEARKYPSVRIVMEKTPDFFCGNMLVAHAIRSLKAIVREVMQGAGKPFALRNYSMVVP